jgi:CheY-like chemotaxis protein
MSQRKTILVVDDIPLMRTILSRYLTSLGPKVLESEGKTGSLEIVEAPSGKEALDCLKKRGADLIFLDLMMPEMDGLTFLTLKGEDPRLRPIPVIVCSALGEKATVERAQELGATSYIVKPFTMKAVEERLREAVSRIDD